MSGLRWAVNAPAARDPGRTALGVGPAGREHGLLPGGVAPVAVQLDGVVRFLEAPSAGLVYALATGDLLNHDDFTAGRVVAATGTISLDGDIGPVGGVDQKAEAAQEAGADVVLVPEKEVFPSIR